MTEQHYVFSLSTALNMLKAAIFQATEEEEVIPKHSAAVVDRMTGYKAEEKRIN